MSNEKSGHVLFQIQDLLRGSSLSLGESALMGFQLLVWAHLSTKDKLDAENKVDTVLTYGTTGIVEALNRLGLIDGSTGQAFGGASRRAQFSGEYIVSALTAAKRLAEGGIFERFSSAEIAAELMQNGTDSIAVPTAVAQLMVNLTMKGSESSAYCPWESNGQFVAALLDKHLRLYVETPFSTPLPALLSFFREAPTEMVLNDPLRSPAAIRGGHLEKFDVALSIPPMGVYTNDDVAINDVYGRFPIKKATGNGLHVQHIVAQTEGTAGIIVSNSFLFGPGRDRELREHLLNKGWVEAVIALPAGVFNGTSIPSTLLLLNTQTSNGEVGFVDATRSYFAKPLAKGRVTLTNTDAILDFCNTLRGNQTSAHNSLDDDLVAVVTVGDILRNDASLQVDRYVISKEQREMQAKLKAVPTETLESVVDVLNPISNKDRGVDSVETFEVYEVGAVDLPSAGYIRTPGKSIQVKLSQRRSGKPDEVFLRPYDIVLIVKGSSGKVGIVPKNVPPLGAGGWIAGQSAVVLRAKEHGLDLRGLGFWLRSKMGQKLLDSIKSGATIPMMSIATLRGLKVIALTPEWTELAAGVLEEEDGLQCEIEILQDEQASIAEDLWSALLKAAIEGTNP